ncbi:hypothetical protein L1987_52555 [Smallanthus sonchifolius]|uniref:Uncharacterized protein n=1 Tax=Smallanthus sonchifolius TaxID=185202 RepID=A0ACB9EUM6_9ASTR|nr:hypothetical protein L1987_52555 [Smallanthus sonchifolius]
MATSAPKFCHGGSEVVESLSTGARSETAMHRFDGNLVAVVEHIRIRILIYLVHIRELEEEVKLLKNLSHPNIVVSVMEALLEARLVKLHGGQSIKQFLLSNNNITEEVVLYLRIFASIYRHRRIVGYAYLVVASLDIAQESATKHAISLREETCTRFMCPKIRPEQVGQMGKPPHHRRHIGAPRHPSLAAAASFCTPPPTAAPPPAPPLPTTA